MSFNIVKDSNFIIFTRDDKSVKYDLDKKVYHGVKGTIVKSIKPFFANLSWVSGVSLEVQKATPSLFELFKVISSASSLSNMGSLIDFYIEKELWDLEKYISAGLDFNIRDFIDKSNRSKLENLSKLDLRNIKRIQSLLISKGDTNAQGKVSFLIKLDSDIRNQLFLQVPDDVILKNSGFIYSNYNIDRLIKSGYSPKDLVRNLLYYYQEEVLLFQESTQYLYDYYNMKSQLLKLSIVKKFEKYPKFLVTSHDIVSKSFSVFKDEIKRQGFESAMLEFQDLSYSSRKLGFSIIVPKEMGELVDESEQLNHCVRSYIESVINGSNVILFVRKTDDVSKSLVTIQLINHSNQLKLVQAKGRFNRSITKEEREFLKKFCTKKEIIYNI